LLVAGFCYLANKKALQPAQKSLEKGSVALIQIKIKQKNYNWFWKGLDQILCAEGMSSNGTGRE